MLSSLILGLVPSWRKKTYIFLDIEWSYETAMMAKGYESSLESGPQAIIQTYLMMLTNFYGWPFWRVLMKGYWDQEDNGKYHR